MSERRRSTHNEVDDLLINAGLRNELEPFFDESIERLDRQALSTRQENEYLASMLAWERAPALPISQWFQPALELPHPGSLDDEQLHTLLWETIHRLYAERIVLDFTDHLSDRQLYSLIYRDILPAHEKKIDSSRHYLHWDCADVGGDPTVWLRYYATPEERENWSFETGELLPAAETPPYPRQLPKRPL